jgi:type III secretory pathway component EscR
VSTDSSKPSITDRKDVVSTRSVDDTTTVAISLPFKLIFFVLVDHWYLVTGSLVQSFGT